VPRLEFAGKCLGKVGGVRAERITVEADKGAFLDEVYLRVLGGGDFGFDRGRISVDAVWQKTVGHMPGVWSAENRDVKAFY
jgi:hypothetical protein